MNSKVKEKYSSYPKTIREKLLELRQLILQVAAQTEGVGPLEETLKWNQLSFCTSTTKSGTTVRIDWYENSPDQLNVFVSCSSRLIAIFRELYPKDFSYDGNRRLSYKATGKLPSKKLKTCIEMALTYHLNNYKEYLKV